VGFSATAALLSILLTAGLFLACWQEKKIEMKQERISVDL
jgi:hypothetical protein